MRMLLGAHFSCRGATLGLRASGWAGQEFAQQELVIFREVWDHGTQQLHIKCWQQALKRPLLKCLCLLQRHKYLEYSKRHCLASAGSKHFT